jgi:hypothetical protein
MASMAKSHAVTIFFNLGLHGQNNGRAGAALAVNRRCSWSIEKSLAEKPGDDFRPCRFGLTSAASTQPSPTGREELGRQYCTHSSLNQIAGGASWQPESG